MAKFISRCKITNNCDIHKTFPQILLKKSLSMRYKRKKIAHEKRELHSQMNMLHKKNNITKSDLRKNMYFCGTAYKRYRKACYY